MTENPSTTFTATVEKVIKSPISTEPDKAQIAVRGADDLYKELRVENTLTDAEGNEVRLKVGAAVEITVEAQPHTVVPQHSKD